MLVVVQALTPYGRDMLMRISVIGSVALGGLASLP